MRALALAALLAFAGVPALAQTADTPGTQAAEASTAELLDLLGYETYAAYFEASLREPHESFAPDQAADWRRVSAGLFRAEALVEAARAGLASLPPEQIQAAVAFLRSPLGREVTALEVAAQDVDRRAEISAAKDLYAADRAAYDPARSAIVERIARAFGTVEDGVAHVMNFQVSYMQGFAAADVTDGFIDLDEFIGMLMADRDEIAETLRGNALDTAAFVYRDLDDDELDAYASFLEGPAAQAIYGVLNGADDALTIADAFVLGQRMAEAGAEQEL